MRDGLIVIGAVVGMLGGFFVGHALFKDDPPPRCHGVWVQDGEPKAFHIDDKIIIGWDTVCQER